MSVRGYRRPRGAGIGLVGVSREELIALSKTLRGPDASPAELEPPSSRRGPVDPPCAACNQPPQDCTCHK